MIKRIIAIISIFITLLFTACSDAAAPPPSLESTAPAEPTADGFDRQALLENITNQVILPAHKQFEQDLQNLQPAVEHFNDNPNEETLLAVQEAWNEANLARMALLPYRIGAVEDSLLHNRLDNRPPRIKFIDETILAGSDPISNEYLDSIGSTSVGLGAMAYLLFDPQGGSAAVLQTFMDGPHVQRRHQLLAMLADNAQQQGSALLLIWLPEGQNYAQTFIDAAMDGGELQGSMNMLVNHMIYDLENIIASRLGKPAGKRSNDMVRPDLVEAPFSQTSLPRIIATVEGIQRAFSGGAGLGFDDYLDYLDAQYESRPLSTAINDQFDATLNALRAIDGPLETAVETDRDQVDRALEELNKLLVLLKVDMANHLGVTLTFNDNDGD